MKLLNKLKILKNNPPSLSFGKTKLTLNHFLTGGYKYEVTKLIEFCKEEGYKPFDLPLASIDLSYLPFDLTSVKELCQHIQRIKDCNYNIPIIISWQGIIADGWHRIIKAIMDGKPTIKAIRMIDSPLASGKDE